MVVLPSYDALPAVCLIFCIKWSVMHGDSLQETCVMFQNSHLCVMLFNSRPYTCVMFYSK